MKKRKKILTDSSKKAHNQLHSFRHEFKNHIVTAITAGIAFLIALVWRDAIQQTIEAITTKLNIHITSAFLYAIYMALLITLIGGIGLVILSRWGAKQNNKK